MTTSAHAAGACRTIRLPALRWTKTGLGSASGASSTGSVWAGSPPAGSTLTTSAPSIAISRPAYGPATPVASSSTRSPASGPLIALGIARERRACRLRGRRARRPHHHEPTGREERAVRPAAARPGRGVHAGRRRPHRAGHRARWSRRLLLGRSRPRHRGAGGRTGEPAQRRNVDRGRLRLLLGPLRADEPPVA